MYYYDLYGWLTSDPWPGRTTDVEPPEETEGLRANWTGEAWVLREYVEPQLPAPASARSRRISVGAFFDRFGSLKWQILADSNPSVKAVVQDASVREYIDLDDPALPLGLAVLQSAGHDVDADAIIHDAPQDRELPRQAYRA